MDTSCSGLIGLARTSKRCPCSRASSLLGGFISPCIRDRDGRRDDADQGSDRRFPFQIFRMPVLFISIVAWV